MTDSFVDQSVSDIEMYLSLARNLVSLNDEDHNGRSYADQIVDKESLNPRDAANRSIALHEMKKAYQYLNVRERQLLFLRNQVGMKVKDIAQILGISEGRISQIYKQIIIKLRLLMRVKT